MFEKIFRDVNPWIHISKLLEEFFKDIVLSSYWICLIAGLIGLLLYIFGCQKAKSVSTIAPVIYIIIRILGSVLLGI